MEWGTELIAKAIGDELIKQKQTLAVAESVTAGYIQAAFASAQDATKFFQGGITAYNLGQKVKHLNVEPIHALEVNSVSEQVASQMAKGICIMMNSDWGCGITGYATPTSESNNQTFCFYAICFRDNIVCEERLNGIGPGSHQIQLEYVGQILNRLSDILNGDLSAGINF